MDVFNATRSQSALDPSLLRSDKLISSRSENVLDMQRSLPAGENRFASSPVRAACPTRRSTDKRHDERQSIQLNAHRHIIIANQSSASC